MGIPPPRQWDMLFDQLCPETGARHRSRLEAPRNMIVLLLFGLTLFPLVFGGTPCPPRKDIYPCVCTEVALSKRTRFTVVTCRSVPHTGALDSAYTSFRGMDIDRLVLVDCFLEAGKFGKEAILHQRLPRNWWSGVQIRELEILDSVLSPGFACDVSETCENLLQTHVSIVNSSSTPSIQTVCEWPKLQKFSWLACLGSLKHFEFTGNRLSVLDRSFFPKEMTSLKEVNMSRNAIQTVEKEAFINLPKMTRLDLSHNEIRRLPRDIFGNTARHLRFLDLSFNKLTTLPPDVHRNTPALEILHLQMNLIKKLDESEWQDMPRKSNLRLIDFSDNNIYCDCYLQWFNASLHIKTVVLGTCSTPQEYVKTRIRRASILLSNRCNGTKETIVN